MKTVVYFFSYQEQVEESVRRFFSSEDSDNPPICQLQKAKTKEVRR